MAKQTFTSGQVLTAAEMNSLQENDYNWTVTTKTASYTLAAGDEGTRIVMNNAGATTITVDDAVFAAGDVVWLHNIGAGTCTITAGTATINTTGSLELAQYGGGQLFFTSASAAIFFPFGGGATMIKKVDRFTASGTWTVPTGVTYAIAHIRGGGGGIAANAFDAGNGGSSSVAFSGGTITAVGGIAAAVLSAGASPDGQVSAGGANSGQGAAGGIKGGVSGYGYSAKDGAYIVAGDTVTPAASITVTVGAGGTAGTGGAAGGSGYVWIEYQEPA